MDREQSINILCILVDDLGYGDLSCQGAGDMRTPHIDAIAARGLTFRNFYANCTVCSPSRASLLTGRFPDLVGVPGVIRQNEQNSWGYLDPEASLIPDLLKPAGYHTAIIGKWHLGLESPNTPTERGFDYFRGFLGDMMDDYWTHLRGGKNWMRLNDMEIDPEGHATDLFTSWAIEYMEERTGEQGSLSSSTWPTTPHTSPSSLLRSIFRRSWNANPAFRKKEPGTWLLSNTWMTVSDR